MKNLSVALGLALAASPVLSDDGWSEEYNLDIAKALVKNKIKGCGEMYHKKNGSNEYFVKCTRDGSTFVYYLVFTSTQKVLGPYDQM